MSQTGTHTFPARQRGSKIYAKLTLFNRIATNLYGVIDYTTPDKCLLKHRDQLGGFSRDSPEAHPLNVLPPTRHASTKRLGGKFA